MEKELFHENLERLYEHFGRDVVFTDVAKTSRFLKLDRRTLLADKTFPVKKMGSIYKVPLISLARWLS